MSTEKSFDAAGKHATEALAWAKSLPHGQFRDYAVDNLKAAIGWIEQARDEWATREAGQ